MRKASTRDIRRSNQLKVLQCIYGTDSITRQQIAEETSLSDATVANVVTDLLKYGIVVEDGYEEPQGGRPRAILRIRADKGYLVGVDVTETYIQFALFDLRLSLRHSTEFVLSTQENDPEQIVGHIKNGLNKLLEQSQTPHKNILGVGVSVQGPVDHRSGVSIFSPNWGWHNVPLLSMLKQAIDLPIYLDNPLKASAVGELWFGAGRSIEDLAVVYLGTGVGAGIIADGALYRGASNSAGEWGHTTLAIEGRECRCGALGCVETYVGAPGIIRTIRELAPESALLHGEPGDQVAIIGALTSALQSGDEDAWRVLREVVRYLGPAVANLINSFNPQVVVISGWVGNKLGSYLLPELTQVVSRYALKPALDAAIIMCSQIPQNEVSIGAATFALEGFLASAEKQVTPAVGRRPAVGAVVA